MNVKELYEYEETELQIVSEVNSGSKAPTITDFYKGLSLTPPYTSHIDPWWVVLPFYNTLIVGIAPLSEEDFKQKYEISPRELVRLQSQGKIQLVLRNRPIAYVGLDYLDEILELKPPTYVRSIGYAERVSGFRFNELANESRLVTGHSLSIPDEEWLETIFGPLKDPTEVAAIFYAQLKALPSTQEIASQINKQCQGKPTSAVFMSLLYGALLAGPVFGSLGGCHVVPLRWAKLASVEREIFPIDVGRELTNIFGLRLPENPETALEIDSGKAIKALMDLEKVVKAKEGKKVLDRSLALREAINEVNQGIKRMERRSTRTSKFIRTGSLVVGIIGPVMEYLSGQPEFVRIILGISSGAAGFALANKFASFVSKFGIPNYIVSIYDVKSHRIK